MGLYARINDNCFDDAGRSRILLPITRSLSAALLFNTVTLAAYSYTPPPDETLPPQAEQLARRELDARLNAISVLSSISRQSAKPSGKNTSVAPIQTTSPPTRELDQLKRSRDTGAPLPPGTKETIHVVGLRQGKPFAQYDPRGTATVKVTAKDSAIVLVLCAHDVVLWKVIVEPGARIKSVILSGFRNQHVEGLPKDVPVTNVTSGKTDKYFYSWKYGDDNYLDLVDKVQRLVPAATMCTFQGRYADDGTPWIVGPESNCWRYQRLREEAERLFGQAVSSARLTALAGLGNATYRAVYQEFDSKFGLFVPNVGSFTIDGPVTKSMVNFKSYGGHYGLGSADTYGTSYCSSVRGAAYSKFKDFDSREEIVVPLQFGQVAGAADAASIYALTDKGLCRLDLEKEKVYDIDDPAHFYQGNGDYQTHHLLFDSRTKKLFDWEHYPSSYCTVTGKWHTDYSTSLSLPPPEEVSYREVASAISVKGSECYVLATEVQNYKPLRRHGEISTLCKYSAGHKLLSHTLLSSPIPINLPPADAEKQQNTQKHSVVRVPAPCTQLIPVGDYLIVIGPPLEEKENTPPITTAYIVHPETGVVLERRTVRLTKEKGAGR